MCRPSTAITCGCHPYSRNGFIASPSTTSGSVAGRRDACPTLPGRRLCEASMPAQSRTVWKIRRVLTGWSMTAVLTPGPAITSGTCMVDW